MSIYIFPKTHTAPEIISLEKAKEHLRIEADFVDEDVLIQDYIQAAINAAENYIATSINEAKFEVHSDSFINFYDFKVTPVQAISSVKYLDEAGDLQTLEVGKYELLPVDQYTSRIRYTDLDTLPLLDDNSTKAVQIEVLTGYATGTVPKAIQSAVLLILTDLYENREDRVNNLPTRSQSLLRSYRIY